MSVIVDVQGFKTDSNKFILKEIAMQCSDERDNTNVLVLLFKPPFPFYELTKTERRQVSWIERNRGIYWNQGFLPYKEHANVIANMFMGKERIFTKGEEKVKWIKELLCDYNIKNCVYNLEDKNCINFLQLYKEYEQENDIISCVYHSKICALKNVLCLRKWYNKNML